MVNSMTAYGRAVNTDGIRTVTAEIKSVNGRYLDCTVKLPRKYLFLEDKIKAFIQSNVISRGKVDVYLTYETTGAVQPVKADTALAKSYYNAFCEIAEACNMKKDFTVCDIARMPDVFTQAPEDTDTEREWAFLLPALEAAGKCFSNMRSSEGAKTRADISEKIERVGEWAKQAEKLSREDIDGYREKLEGRIKQILADNRVTIDENRILTECAIVADRLAVDEEISRLESHRHAFYEIMDEKGPCGKKLDFLMQEFNRETNTLGSKANNSAVARLVVNMKNELEKIREQVQNIE